MNKLVAEGVSKNVIDYFAKKGYDLEEIYKDLSKLPKSESFEINGYEVVLERGMQKGPPNSGYGWVHVILRHKYGYMMENVKETSFFPMGQRVVDKNGNVFYIPNRMNENDLINIIKEAVMNNKNEFNGADRVKITYNLHGRYGIDEVKVIFYREGNEYHLLTAFPESGRAVIKYEKDSGRFVYTK